MNMKQITISFALVAGILAGSIYESNADGELATIDIEVPSYAMTPEQESSRYHFLTKEDGFRDVYDFYLNTRSIWIDVGFADKSEFNHLEECSMEEQTEYAALKAEHFGGEPYVPVAPVTQQAATLNLEGL